MSDQPLGTMREETLRYYSVGDRPRQWTIALFRNRNLLRSRAGAAFSELTHAIWEP